MKLKRLLLNLLLVAVISVPSYAQVARLQVIHNSADAAASTVDVWLTVGMGTPTKLIDDFQFRTATPFIDAPAGQMLRVGIAPGNSMSVSDTIRNFNLMLTSGATYVAVANGIVSPSGYSPAPAFGLDIYTMGLEAAQTPTNTDVLVCHGSTDAPTVDVVEVGAGAGTIVDNAPYRGFAGYLELPTADYALQIRTAEGNTTVAEFGAPLATLGLNGAAAVVVASGFLDPTSNSNGPAFGLYVALPSGGALVQLPSQAISTARVQVIHNAADLAAATVDVWLNDAILLNDFAFRTASPFIDAPAGVNFDISIQPANSSDTINALARFTYNLSGGEKYILVANGIVSPTGYSPVQPFDIYVKAGARELAETPGNVDVLVFHGATDAPAVDVVEVGVGAGTIVPNASYEDFAGYLDLAELDYRLNINAAGTSTTVATYEAPLQTLNLGDQAITVLASGFLTPANNSNGPAFGLYVATAAGGNLLPLPLLTSVEDGLNSTAVSVFPNPVSDFVAVNLGDMQQKATLMITDLTGRVMVSTEVEASNSGLVTMDVRTLPSGIYSLVVASKQEKVTTRIAVTH